MASKLKTAVIVQARTGSTRLPGKILKSLGPATVLDEVLRRCGAIAGADVVVCAIPESSEDDIIVPIAERANAIVVRGPSSDVLARYLLAAHSVKADVIMRVTSDCPLIDPGLCAALLAVRSGTSADYVANNMPPSFPHGLDSEVFTTDALSRADRLATADYDREHVTPWLRRDESTRRAVFLDPDKAEVAQRWTLDFPNDYAFISRLFDLLPPPPAIPNWRDVLKCIAAHPELAEINAMHRVTRT